MTHADLYEFASISVCEARSRGYEIEKPEDEWVTDPETIKDNCARRILIQRCLKIWETYAFQWRTCICEYTYYFHIKDELHIGVEVPAKSTFEDFPHETLFTFLNKEDAFAYLQRLDYSTLFQMTNFVYDAKKTCKIEILVSFSRKIRDKLGMAGITQSFTGDIIKCPYIYKLGVKNKGKAATFAGSVTPIPVKKYNERSMAAAMY